jgi:hypothetical protein
MPETEDEDPVTGLTVRCFCGSHAVFAVA